MLGRWWLRLWRHKLGNETLLQCIPFVRLMLIITNITIMQGLLKHNVEVEWRRKWGRACRFFTVIVAMHPGFNMFPSFDSFLASIYYYRGSVITPAQLHLSTHISLPPVRKAFFADTGISPALVRDPK